MSADPKTTAVKGVLDGERSYDDVDGDTQALVRAARDAGIERRRADLNLAAEFREACASWVEADEDGNVVHCR